MLRIDETTLRSQKILEEAIRGFTLGRDIQQRAELFRQVDMIVMEEIRGLIRLSITRTALPAACLAFFF